jgi:hypothetical protein
MHKLFAAITFAFLLGITLAGCAEVSDLRTSLLKQSSDLQSKPSDIWQNTADRGGE